MVSRDGILTVAAVLALATLPATGLSQSARRDTEPAIRDSADAREAAVRRQRRGAGLRSGSWQQSGLTTASGAAYSTTPAFEGYFQRGLDRHLVIETSAGFWSRSQRANSGSGSEEIRSYVVPFLTSLKLYPATGPEQPLEPFLSAGVGFTLGVDDRNTVSGGLLGGTGGGTVMLVGVGAKGGAGIEYRLGPAFGVTAAGGYQYVRFFEAVGGERTYKGVQIFGGLTYRFQY